MEKTSNSFSFGLNIIDHALVDALRQALENVMPEIMADHGLTERLGYGQFRWNAIISQLHDKCQHLGWIDFGLCQRRAWKTPVIFHPASRNIFTFMTEDTFDAVQRRTDKGKHYLCGGASFNPNVQPRVEQIKMEFPPVDEASNKWIAESREKLAACVRTDVGDISGHILILFDVNNDRLLSVRAVRLTCNLEISAEEEDLSKYISKPYAANQTVIPQQNDGESEEALVELI